MNEQRDKIINFIKQNPKTTYKDLREKLKIHPERIFKNGMQQAFKEAEIKPPRTFEKKTKEEKENIIIKYIKKYPKASGQIIKKDTKINISDIFKNIKEAYKKAKVKYPREESYKLSPKEKKELIIELIKKDPYITLPKLIKISKIKNIYRLFKNLNDVYKKAGTKRINRGEKIINKKRKIVINFIKDKPFSTQREINKKCRTHVQEIFKKGIFEAYQKAGIEYPFERLKLYGAVLKQIKERAKSFEDKMAVVLSGYGKVNRLVKTKRGVVDIILERKNKKIAIEIKDYQNKDISFSQIKQLNKYLEDLKINLGILICHKKPKRDRFLIGKNRIFILHKEELEKISKLAGI